MVNGSNKMMNGSNEMVIGSNGIGSNGDWVERNDKRLVMLNGRMEMLVKSMTPIFIISRLFKTCMADRKTYRAAAKCILVKRTRYQYLSTGTFIM